MTQESKQKQFQVHNHVGNSYITPKSTLLCIGNPEENLCLVLLQVPKYFVLVQIFCARPKIYSRIIAVTNILCQTKKLFAFSKLVFVLSQKFLKRH